MPHDRVFLAGETEEGGFLTTSYATHHRQSCIGARAGFGDLLIGAGALMIEANGLDADRHAHIRDQMVELIGPAAPPPSQKRRFRCSRAIVTV
ncbi:4-hydroxyphenylacetate 3-hydroxylase C-terminal domain-containing protein [uncultured Paracoccus sp.]|uniref:4-hydroxyphenylacetate 3-hydroxylase C-terminal domain-containing protein n=1 Tax=uncultured Paracoccus sp. TaxID=189685 RepID=UPI00262D0544|nr:4-hydroxyphenylacetate 3-hydroxylase C-terminal domain-containing protein [uncultured Paracoccus sp.]